MESDDSVLNEYAKQVIEVVNKGCEVAVVIGGGNIFRGLSGTESGFDRVKRRSDGNAGNRYQQSCP